MKAVLLAAGKGTRLSPLTDVLPKVMIRVNGRPLLERHVEQLAEAEVRDIFINLHHLPESITGHFRNGDRWGVRIRYSYEPEILGTAGAVGNLRAELEDGPFLVVYGDNYLTVPYPDLIAWAEKRAGLGTIAVFKKEAAAASGVLEIGVDSRVLGFREKPRAAETSSPWVNAGVYYLRPEILESIGPGFSDFGFDIFPSVLHVGKRIHAFRLSGEVWGADSPELLSALRKQTGD